jgi:hypothetical protein
MKALRILAVIVGVGFLILLLVGFDNILELLRSRVTLFLALGPVVVLFIWSVYKAFSGRKEPSGDVIDLPPDKP